MSRYQLSVVQQDATTLDMLAERYRRAFGKLKAGREQWIEGTLEAAIVVAVLRDRYLSHQEFSRWLERMKLQKIDKNQRTALLWLAEDLEVARKVLEQTESWSWELIYRNRQQTPLPNPRKGAQRPNSRSSGAHWRSRAKRIPDVMREPPSVPPVPTKRLSDMGLTPEQVDPDFKGTPLEFATKYGHVNLQTKDQIEHHRQQEALAAWLAAVQTLDRASRTMLTALAGVDPAIIGEWKSRNGKADKLRGWCDSIQMACEAICKLTA